VPEVITVSEEGPAFIYALPPESDAPSRPAARGVTVGRYLR
jgi:hypothetical protein